MACLIKTCKSSASFKKIKENLSFHKFPDDKFVLKQWIDAVAREDNWESETTRKMYEEVNDTFLYFAYGSNLLKKRIHINNKTAEFLGIGRLEDHQLNFIKYSENWRGASATIVPTESSHIWGAIWRVHNKDMPALDKQEGVDTNWYFPKTVDVITPEGFRVECRTYQQTVNPPPRAMGEELPHDRRPCITYLECIVEGAEQCKLPPSYIAELKKIPHNGQVAPAKMIEKLKKE